MIRQLAVLGVVGGMLVGCVSLDPSASTGPSSPPSIGLTTASPATATPAQTTATPAAAPTPTAPPTSPPTLEPTAEAGSLEPLPSAGASPSPVDNFGASTPLFDDQFDDPNSGWGVGTNEGGSVAYDDGDLVVNAAAGGAWEWTRRLTGSTDNAVHVEGVYTPSGPGYMGLLCGENDDELWGAMANLDDGHYAFIKLAAAGATVLSEGYLDILRLDPGEISRLALDCAGTATGEFRMQVYSAGINEGAQYFGAPGEGPTAIDRVGIYTQSIDDPYSLTVDYVIGFGGDGDTSPTPDEVELMTHVPADWQPDCFEAFASFYAVGAQADILCQLFDGRSDYAEYASFDTKANMDAYLQYLGDKYAVPESGLNCDAGAHQGTYTIGGQMAGQILCAPDPLGGTRLFWTFDDLLILSDLDDNEGSYADMYADWLVAGPN